MADTNRKAVVIDTDPGIDDVVTLALAARCPELEIVAVTTTYGNATLPLTTRNARLALALAGRSDIPVLAGAARPLVRGLVTAPETHGESGIGYATAHPAPPVEPDPQVLLRVLDRAPEPVTLVTLGPLTNLASALDADPGFVKDRVRRHIGMFGNLYERGNTNRWADFNAWCDPEAAEMVIAAELPSEMVGLDVTRRMTFSSMEVERLSRSDRELVRWLAAALRFYVEFHRAQERLDGCVVNDILTVAELVVPGVLAFGEHKLKIVTAAGEEQGRTVPVPEGGASVNVAVDVDVTRVRRLLDRVFGTGWDESIKGG